LTKSSTPLRASPGWSTRSHSSMIQLVLERRSTILTW